jgi:hypothetical protein
MYDPTLGVFITRDPIGYRGGTNLYEYASDSPSSRIDPTGTETVVGGLLEPYPAPLGCHWVEDVCAGGVCTTVQQHWRLECDSTGGPSHANPAQPSQPSETGPSSIEMPNPYQQFCDEANRRRCTGPWDDSAQHCWAACYIAMTGGSVAGHAAATVEDIAECFAPSDDWLRDDIANHVGADLGGLGHWLFGSFSNFVAAAYCDKACGTSPRAK